MIFSEGKSHPFIDYAPTSPFPEHVLPFYKVVDQLNLNKAAATVKTDVCQVLRILQFLHLASSTH